MDFLHVDVETYSELSIKKAGAYKYTADPSFEVLLLSYRLNDGQKVSIEMIQGVYGKVKDRDAKGRHEGLDGYEVNLGKWKEFISLFHDKSIVLCAHNANFERLVFSRIGHVTSPDRWFCTMAKSAYCGYPLGLDDLSKALDLGTAAKSASGKALIKYFSEPCKPTKINGGRTRNWPYHDLEKWNEFRAYCDQDVEAECAIAEKLSIFKFPKMEKKIYVLDQNINDRGFAIDLDFVKLARKIDAEIKEVKKRRLQMLTGVENPNSVEQIKSWLSSRDFEVPSLSKDLIDQYIEDAGGIEVAECLRLRRSLSDTSVSKYAAMESCIMDDGRVRGLLQYYGAFRTGRWAGRNIQIHNLKHTHKKGLDNKRKLVKLGDSGLLQMIYNNMDGMLSKLIRTAFVAPNGKKLVPVDFSAIEARVLAWVAGEKWRLQVFKGDGKIYEASASKMFRVPIELITKDSEYRKKGKIAELALGYQGSVGALTKMGGADMGLNEEEMLRLVKAWRRENRAIVKFWYDLVKFAVICVQSKRPIDIGYKGIIFSYEHGHFLIRLPSGRKLHYPDAEVCKGKYDQETIRYKGFAEESNSSKGTKAKKWTWVLTYGGKLCENIIQAIARDLLAHGMLSLDAAGYKICGHVHDEAICEVPAENVKKELANISKLVCEVPSWAADFPSAAAGHITDYYIKD